MSNAPETDNDELIDISDEENQLYTNQDADIDLSDDNPGDRLQYLLP